MRLKMKSVVLPLVAVVLAAAADAELVLDVRTPHSTLVESHIIQAIMSWHSQNLDKAMKAKYGPNAETNFESGPPRLVIRSDGKVVHEAPLSEMFEGVRGSFEIGASGQQTVSTFPIWFAVPSPPDHSSAMVRRRYFVDSDVDEKRSENYVGDGPCVVLAASDLGRVGAAVRLKSLTFCVVEWTGSRRASMLIGAALTDGGPFVRPFSRRICRSLAALALRKLTAAGSQAVQYAGCMLFDRSGFVDGPQAVYGFVDGFQVHVYEVLRTGELALIGHR
jgi:rhodanese-related sulfurtransferase